MCGLKSSFEDHLARLPSSLPHLIFFLYTSRWKTSQSANETLPTDGNCSSSQSSPGASLALVPPVAFITLSISTKCFSGIKKSGARKWVTSEKNPATGFLLFSRFDSLYRNREWTKTPLSTAVFRFIEKKIKARRFFWNLREHVVAEGSLTGTIVFYSFIQAASLMRQTITAAPCLPLLLGFCGEICKTFPRLEQCPVGQF